MKSYVKILLAVVFCVGICQSNVQGQGFKKALNKAKGAISNVTHKGEGTPVADKVTSAGPAKPLAPDVKNSVSAIRAYTGLTKVAFEAKMKSLGFVAADDELGMNGQAYKSKSAGYMLAVKYGTRGNDELVREVFKGTIAKTPNLGTIKTTFLGIGKQCTDLKAEYSSGFVEGMNKKGNVKNLRTADDRTSKFLPAFDTMISTKEEGGAVDAYSENDYEYNITYRYAKVIGAVIIISVTDNTVESMEG